VPRAVLPAKKDMGRAARGAFIFVCLRSLRSFVVNSVLFVTSVLASYTIPAMEPLSTSRREFILATTASLLAARTGRAHQGTVTAQQVADRIRSAVGVAWRPQTNDGFKAGDPSTVVTGIATTVMASTDVLRRAAAVGQNLIVTEEPLFYSMNDDPGNRAKDAVYQAKKTFIDEHHLVVFRFAEHWNSRQPNASAKALAAALKWTSEVPDAPQTYRIADTTLEGLATQIRSHLPIRGGLRMVGQPGMRVRTVFLAPGTTSLSMAVSNLPHADVVLAGEPREWEAVPYTLDTWSAGSGKGLIAIGRLISEGPGMQACAEWVRSLVPEVRVESIPVADPYWSINA
jgi:putative NIF3 family GTP cyclohydrolase 1 type 2